MARCIGSGVPGDEWQYGHTIKPGTEMEMLGIQVHRNTSRRQARCVVCRSTINALTKQDFKIKASLTLAIHADKVAKRFGITPEQARQQMPTINEIAELFKLAWDQPCPGMCPQNGDRTKRHRITTYDDMHLDWRDPAYMMTLENCGALCGSCNRQKGKKPWAWFMSRQRAIRLNFSYCPGDLPPLTLFDGY